MASSVWPDGTVAGGYRFMHALYQEVAYHRLTAARRVQLHRRIGEREEAGYGPQVRERAAELAMHFSAGGTPNAPCGICSMRARTPSSARPIRKPSSTSPRVWPCSPRSPRPRHATSRARPADRPRSGVECHEEPCGPGGGADVLTRARALCAQVGRRPQLFAALWGLWRFYNAGRSARRRRSLGNSSCSWRSASTDPARSWRAHAALGQTLFGLGDFASARTHLEQGIALIDPQTSTRPCMLLLHGEAPGCGAWPWRPRRCGAGLSGAGRAAESGGAGAGPGAGASL